MMDQRESFDSNLKNANRLRPETRMCYSNESTFCEFFKGSERKSMFHYRKTVGSTLQYRREKTNLVKVLQYENFDFAKLLLRNRWKVYFLTRLGQAQTDEAKEQIQSEMSDSTMATTSCSSPKIMK